MYMICKQNSLSVTFLNEPELICLHTVECLDDLQFNTNNSIQYYSFIHSQLNGYKYC